MFLLAYHLQVPANWVFIVYDRQKCRVHPLWVTESNLNDKIFLNVVATVA